MSLTWTDPGKCGRPFRKCGRPFRKCGHPYTAASMRDVLFSVELFRNHSLQHERHVRTDLGADAAVVLRSLGGRRVRHRDHGPHPDLAVALQPGEIIQGGSRAPISAWTLPLIRVRLEPCQIWSGHAVMQGLLLH